MQAIKHQKPTIDVSRENQARVGEQLRARAVVNSTPQAIQRLLTAYSPDSPDGLLFRAWYALGKGGTKLERKGDLSTLEPPELSTIGQACQFALCLGRLQEPYPTEE